jgi:serine protease Do
MWMKMAHLSLKVAKVVFGTGVLVLPLGSATWSYGQSDVRLYRGVNHIILGVRQLKQGETASMTVDLANNRHFAVLKWGAGCFVSKDGLMLTANHVVAGAESYFVAGWTNGIFSAVDVRARDEKLDLAVIKITPPESVSWINPPFRDTSSIIEGTNVFIWAYLFAPGAFMQFFRSGTISNNTPVSGLDRTLYIETSAIDGTSGSPVFQRGTGEPIGIVTSKINIANLPSGVITAVPGEQVNAFLKNAGVPGY